MKRFIFSTAAALFILALPFEWAASEKHKIQKGDHLWGISQRILGAKTPAQTMKRIREIRGLNRYIKNPDLIYPDNWLNLVTPVDKKRAIDWCEHNMKKVSWWSTDYSYWRGFRNSIKKNDLRYFSDKGGRNISLFFEYVENGRSLHANENTAEKARRQ